MNREQALMVLGLPLESSPAAIKQGYRDMAMVWHPDRFPNDERLQAKALEKLKEINEAYLFLKELPRSDCGTQSGAHTATKPQAPPEPPTPKPEYQRPTPPPSNPSPTPKEGSAKAKGTGFNPEHSLLAVIFGAILIVCLLSIGIFLRETREVKATPEKSTPRTSQLLIVSPIPTYKPPPTRPPTAVPIKPTSVPRPTPTSLPDYQVASRTTYASRKLGLMWTTVYSRDFRWEQAREQCGNLVMDDFRDWRLPTVVELRLIPHWVDFQTPRDVWSSSGDQKGQNIFVFQTPMREIAKKRRDEYASSICVRRLSSR